MRPRIIFAISLVAPVFALGPGPAVAKTVGPVVFCDTYPDSPLCAGLEPSCSLCHSSTPEFNGFGADITARLLPSEKRPLTNDEYFAAVPDVLAAIEGLDSDGDGVANYDEIAAGTFPGDPASVPVETGCPGDEQNPFYNVCGYDPRYALKKIYLDVCGHSPSFDEAEAFSALGPDEQRARLHEVLDQCLQSEFWRGKNGVLWQLAHDKVRPVGSVKAGEDGGAFPLSDYYDDYNLFAWAHTDDNDVRAILTADFYVTRTTDPMTAYQQVDNLAGQFMQTTRRAGMLTTNWVMNYNVMATPLPRTAAAQAYRAFLGFDISKLEGLYPIADEPVDYDDKGVADPECAVCHSTLDPLSYPFRNYNGFSGTPGQFARYVEDRLELLFADEAPNITDTPEAGAILGQSVADLVEWAQVAANSTEFLIATVSDYWSLFTGRAPTPTDAEFPTLYQRLGTEHGYSIERMLHDLIDTEAYGVP